MRSNAPVTLGSPRSIVTETPSYRVTEAWFPPSTVLAPHAHDRAILAVMLHGSFRTTIARTVLPCVHGTSWIEPLGELHANQVGTLGARVLVVQPDSQRRMPTGLARVLDDIRLLRDPRLISEAWRIVADLRVKDAYTELSLDARVTSLLALATRISWSDSNAGSAPRWLSRVQERLRDEWRNPPSLTTLAASAGVHPAHLARTFQRYYGMSVGSFVRRLRTAWAASQVAETRRPLSEIAVEAGFSDQSHLTRELKAEHGVAPSVFRRLADPTL